MVAIISCLLKNKELKNCSPIVSLKYSREKLSEKAYCRVKNSVCCHFLAMGVPYCLTRAAIVSGTLLQKMSRKNKWFWTEHLRIAELDEVDVDAHGLQVFARIAILLLPTRTTLKSPLGNLDAVMQSGLAWAEAGGQIKGHRVAIISCLLKNKKLKYCSQLVSLKYSRENWVRKHTVGLKTLYAATALPWASSTAWLVLPSFLGPCYSRCQEKQVVLNIWGLLSLMKLMLMPMAFRSSPGWPYSWCRPRRHWNNPWGIWTRSFSQA